MLREDIVRWTDKPKKPHCHATVLPAFQPRQPDHHHVFMWLHASLKPKRLPIFWLWLTQTQRLFIRARLRRRLKKQPTMHAALRKHERIHWYGMLATRGLWKKKKTPRRRNWMPPINSETVQELAIATLFKSLQLRHDLLLDPHLRFRPNMDGRSGHAKVRRAQRYWRRVHQAIPHNTECLRVVLTELQKIIVSLHRPFDATPACHEPWPWPAHISLDHFLAVFDVDFMLHQIRHGLFCLDTVMHLVLEIVTPLCPASARPLLGSLKLAFLENQFGLVLRHCFSLLEVIKLDCANRILHQYRPYLLNTCATIEFHCFKRQLESGQISLESTYNWLHDHWTQHPNIHLNDVYHRGLVDLISTHPPLRFPITLQFDERRLTQQLRHEFQTLMVVSLVLIPYRYIAGRYATPLDMARLQRHCKAEVVDAYRLAHKSCQRAFQAHYRHYNNPMQLPQLTTVAQFWGHWLCGVLQGGRLYQLIHDRLCDLLCFLAQHGQPALANNAPMRATMDLMVGIQDTILVLGHQLKRVADLNLDTFGNLYKVLALDIQHLV